MQNFDFRSPTYFAFGRDTEHRAGELCRRFGAKKVLLHYGQGSVIRSGLLDRVKQSLEAAGVDFVELGGVVPNPHLSLVYEGIEICRRESVDLILAVGAGSAIDSAKAIAVGAVNQEDIWQLITERKEITKALPVATVLTLPATGSEASSSTVITNTATKQKYGFGSELLRPVFSIMNPELTFTLPQYQTACGIMDMMSHLFERYFTPSTGVDLTDRMIEACLLSIIDNTKVVMQEPVNYDARANLMWAGTLAHNNIVGVGRVQDWSSHAMEHELSALYDVAHGAGLAVVFPAFMRYTMDHDIERYAQLASRVWQVEPQFKNLRQTALAGIEALEAFIRDELKLPLSFAELGAKAEDIPYLTERCRFGAQDKLGHFRPLSRADVAEIYKLAL
ncbi:MAG: iron-containing alcohol dehydrogenase [Eubacteriales bacterium]|nr:iron-containing alcohol dehydrogenase [Eubacteriales bacterium]